MDHSCSRCHIVCFFFNDPATTEIYTLSLHDALPILRLPIAASWFPIPDTARTQRSTSPGPDRKSTRLNSSHLAISYAVFCLEKNGDELARQVGQGTLHFNGCLAADAAMLPHRARRSQTRPPGRPGDAALQRRSFFFKGRGDPAVPPSSPPGRSPN